MKLPPALTNIRESLRAHKDGDKQFIKILLQVAVHGLDKVNEACAHALKVGISDANFIKQYLVPTAPPEEVEERSLQLKETPNKDLHCYNEVFLTTEFGLCQEATHVVRKH